MHNAAFRSLAIDLVYVVLPCQQPDLGDVVDVLRTVDARGANVTVPHKRQVMPHVDVLTDEALLIGAVNTLVIDPGRIVGDNIDADGLAAAWRQELAGLALTDGVLIVGTGGAARAAAVAAQRVGAPVTIAGRRVDAAEELAAAVTVEADVPVQVVGLNELSTAVLRNRMIVNATPLGMAGEPLPAACMELQAGQIAYDLVYEPWQTPFLAAARARGVTACNGYGMLVAQAGLSFTAWTGQPAPLAVMAAAGRQVPSRQPERPAPRDRAGDGAAGPDTGTSS